MAASTKTLTIFITMMMVCSFMVNSTNANSISYGAIGGDGKPICKDGNCEGDAANGYNRGCESEDRCRTDNIGG